VKDNVFFLGKFLPDFKRKLLLFFFFCSAFTLGIWCTTWARSVLDLFKRQKPLRHEKGVFGCVLASGWLREASRNSDRLNNTMDCKGHVEKLELNDT